MQNELFEVDGRELLLDDDSPFFFPKKGIQKNISLCSSYGNRKILKRDVTIAGETQHSSIPSAQHPGFSIKKIVSTTSIEVNK